MFVMFRIRDVTDGLDHDFITQGKTNWHHVKKSHFDSKYLKIFEIFFK